jgi:hypothetical protein
MFARWVIPPCIIVAVLLHISAALVRDLKTMLLRLYDRAGARAAARSRPRDPTPARRSRD